MGKTAFEFRQRNILPQNSLKTPQKRHFLTIFNTFQEFFLPTFFGHFFRKVGFWPKIDLEFRQRKFLSRFLGHTQFRQRKFLVIFFRQRNSIQRGFRTHASFLHQFSHVCKFFHTFASSTSAASHHQYQSP